MVGQSTQNLNIEGLNPATGTGREKRLQVSHIGYVFYACTIPYGELCVVKIDTVDKQAASISTTSLVEWNGTFCIA